MPRDMLLAAEGPGKRKSKRKWLVIVLGCLLGLGSPAPESDLHVFAVEIEELNYEGRAHFLIRTESCVWYFDRAGGGFSRLIDRDGRDWIGFRKDPLSEYPTSAAAGYRGMPNAVFVGPDKGAGHPGFDQCTSEIAGPGVIRSTSLSGKWEWTWTFSESFATFSMERADVQHPWWFLYEGPIAGTFRPKDKFWGTDGGDAADALRLREGIPDNHSQWFDTWQTLFVGDRQVPRVLAIHQVTPDQLPDTFWFLGSSEGGSAQAEDGMVVVGFGRGSGTRPQLRGAGIQFTVGLIELTQSELTQVELGDGTAVAERVIGWRDFSLAASQSERAEAERVESERAERGIDVWYGSPQHFGVPSLTQRWINVLGNIAQAGQVREATYRLDGGPPRALR